MKTIHLKCGHKLTVRTWPSRAGMAKVRSHYKKFHPTRMKKMTRKSLATKATIKKVAIKWRESLPKGFKMRKSTFDKIVRDVMATTKRKRGLINPKKAIPHKKCPYCGKIRPSYLYQSHVRQCKGLINPKKRRMIRNRCKPNPKPVVIYDKLLDISARKGHGKFAGQNFKHDFKSKTDAMVLGNPDGSLTIRSKKGKRLWKKFNY